MAYKLIAVPGKPHITKTYRGWTVTVTSATRCTQSNWTKSAVLFARNLNKKGI